MKEALGERLALSYSGHTETLRSMASSAFIVSGRTSGRHQQTATGVYRESAAQAKKEAAG